MKKHPKTTANNKIIKETQKMRNEKMKKIQNVAEEVKIEAAVAERLANLMESIVTGKQSGRAHV